VGSTPKHCYHFIIDDDGLTTQTCWYLDTGKTINASMELQRLVQNIVFHLYFGQN